MIKETIHWATLATRTRQRLQECRDLIASTEDGVKFEGGILESVSEEVELLFSYTKNMKSCKAAEIFELLRNVAVEHKMKNQEMKLIEELEKYRK